MAEISLILRDGQDVPMPDLRLYLAREEAKLAQANQALATGTVAALVGTRTYATQSALYADLSPADDLFCLVYADPDPLKNGLYQKDGATGVGSHVGPLDLFASAAEALVQPLVDAAETAAIAAQAAELEAESAETGADGARSEAVAAALNSVAARDQALSAAQTALASSSFIDGGLAAGEAETEIGDFFAVEEPAGVISYRVRTVGGSTEIANSTSENRFVVKDAGGDIPLGLPETNNAYIDILTGSGAKRGLHIESHASVEALDLRLFPDATSPTLGVLHNYRLNGISLQSDAINTGFHFYAKNSENGIWPGQKGSASLFGFSVYVNPGDAFPTEVAQWTDRNVINATVDALPLTVSGKGFVVVSNSVNRAFDSTSLTDAYAGKFIGQKNGIYIGTSEDEGNPFAIVKNGTGGGSLMNLSNHGSGDFYRMFNGSGVEQSRVDSAGQVYVQGNRVLSTRQPFIPDPSGGTTVDTESRAAIAAILDLLAAHGQMAAS